MRTDSESLLREWQELPKDDPDAIAEHLAKLRAIATYLNANMRLDVATE